MGGKANKIAAVLDKDLLGGSGVDGKTTYPQTKFVALLGAHWWRRQLAGKCDVVAVSPGLIPQTGIGRGSGMVLPVDNPDAKSVAEGEEKLPAPAHVTFHPIRRPRRSGM